MSFLSIPGGDNSPGGGVSDRPGQLIQVAHSPVLSTLQDSLPPHLLPVSSALLGPQHLPYHVLSHPPSSGKLTLPYPVLPCRHPSGHTAPFPSETLCHELLLHCPSTGQVQGHRTQTWSIKASRVPRPQDTCIIRSPHSTLEEDSVCKGSQYHPDPFLPTGLLSTGSSSRGSFYCTRDETQGWAFCTLGRHSAPSHTPALFV